MAANRDICNAVTETIEARASSFAGATRYRKPLVGFAATDDPRFLELRDHVDPRHALPSQLLSGARSVISFFLPFDEEVVQANARHRREVARGWAVAYVETNALIERIISDVMETLRGMGVRAAAEPPTGKFDRATLASTWSHKSVAVIAGLGSIGLHHMLITDWGCAGRLGSLVVDAELATERREPVERCLHHAKSGCLECVQWCPVGALRPDGSLDKQRCWVRCQSVAASFRDVGLAEVCGKCVLGPCAMVSAV